MAEIVAAVAAVASAAVATWNANKERLNDKIESQNLKEIHDNLIDIIMLLCAIRDDYEIALKKNGAKMKATSTYNYWSEKVIKLKGEVDAISVRYKLREKKKWNLMPDKVMKRNMKKKSLDANRLCELGTQLGDIFVEKEPDCFIKMNALDFKNLPTFENHLETILNWVTNGNNKVRCVRVWGMPGSGKTSIIQNLNNHETVHGHFDFVIWLDVSTEKNENNLSIGKLREKVVQRLKLNLEGVGNHEIVDMIREKLKNKKTLLLLDDVKKDLELNEIGLDSDDIKIILTMTIKSVCRSMVDKVIEVRRLPLGEAFEMFKGILGQRNQNEDPRIDRVIVQIVQYCDGLPLLIHKLANSFKMRDTVDSWSDGYESLRVWGDRGDSHMIPLYKSLNACFDELGEAQKKCFFYSAIYPQDCDMHIDCLYECWAAEELYESVDVVDSESLRAHGNVILEHLKNVTLLEEGASNEHVTMQKWIRRAALYRLASDDKEKHLVEIGKSLLQPPEDERWKDKKWISLADNDMRWLPYYPECYSLSTLFLQKNPSLKKIPSLFFKFMGKLRVLNVDGTGINSLPSSISMLVNVKVLYLNGCSHLEVFPSQIVELKNVEVLDIRCIGISTIPPEIASLNLLRRLSVSFPIFDSEVDIQVVSKNCEVISKILKLKVLIIDVKSHKNFCNDMQHFVIDKVANTLSLLTTFKFCFEGGVEDHVMKTVASIPTFNVPTTAVFKGFLQRRVFSDREAFQVFIGYSSSLPPQIPNFHNYSRYLRYCNGKGSDDTICKLLTKTDALEMFHVNELEYLSDFGITNLEKIQGCLIGACNQVRAISSNMDSPILLNLEVLYIKMMPALERILKGPIPSGSLFKLKILKIENCPLIREVFADLGNATSNDELLPHLQMLVLSDTKNLTMICSYNSLVWPALKELQIDGCPKLTELPFGKDGARNIQSVKAEKIWWDNLTWRNQEVKGRFDLHFVPS